MVTLDPLAVRVAGILLLFPTATPPKSKALALAVNCPAETPFADKGIFRAWADPFEATAIDPDIVPLPSGVHRTLKVTLWPLPRLVGSAKPLTPNPGPFTVA